MPKVLITGADGFIGKNLRLYLAERAGVQVVSFTRENTMGQLPDLLEDVDFIFHLAGVNRPQDPAEFDSGNYGLTQALCDAVSGLERGVGQSTQIVFASSSQAALDNAYGRSKRAAEDALFSLQHQYNVPVHVFRLPNVFGKWARPNYNSVVATFCHNIAHDLPIHVTDPDAMVTLVYVDDVVQRFVGLLDGADAARNNDGFDSVAPQYSITVGALAEQIHKFRDSRTSLLTERVGMGLTRALYSTYVSYLPIENFSYAVPQHGDVRGVFVEMMKTPDCGQFSYFTAHPGITRGGHYHHSKTEKFLIIKGRALFRFRHMHTNETYSLEVSAGEARVVETVPGWTHDITNIGSDEMVVMLWANEVFDRNRPDTYTCPL